MSLLSVVLFISTYASLVSTTRLYLVQDVTISDSRNYNNIPYLIVGLHPGFANKRSLLQFTSPPSSCRVSSAQLYLNFVYAHKASAFTWRQAPLFPRTVVAHRVLKAWDEAEATDLKRLSNAYWTQRFLGLGSDVASTPTSSGVVVYPPFQKGQKWYRIDVTSAVRDWKYGQPNYGLLIRALHEDRPGRDFRFARDNAYIQLTCSGRSNQGGGNIFPPSGNGKPGPGGEVPAI